MRSWKGEFISPRTSAYATIRAVAGTYASSSVAAAAADTRVAHATRPVASDAISTPAAANRNIRVRFFIGKLLAVTDYTGRAGAAVSITARAHTRVVRSCASRATAQRW